MDLRNNGINLKWSKAKYSINKGLWGTSVGGDETLTSDKKLPNEAYPSQLLSDEEKESLRYAKEILESPEFMSSTWVGQYFDGMFSKDFADLVPMYAGIRNANIQDHIRKLLKKPSDQLTDQEKETLMLWHESAKLESKVSEMSNAYSAGAGTVDSFRFMIEMLSLIHI